MHFSSGFFMSWTPFRPITDSHILLVEVKLTVKLLNGWLEEESLGCKHLFFNRDLESFTKAIMINGGQESSFFMGNLTSSMDPHDMYKSAIEKLTKCKINVFYKVWASGETMTEMFNENRELKAENRELKAENVRLAEKVENLDHKLDEVLRRFAQ